MTATIMGLVIMVLVHVKLDGKGEIVVIGFARRTVHFTEVVITGLACVMQDILVLFANRDAVQMDALVMEDVYQMEHANANICGEASIVLNLFARIIVLITVSAWMADASVLMDLKEWIVSLKCVLENALTKDSARKENASVNMVTRGKIVKSSFVKICVHIKELVLAIINVIAWLDSVETFVKNDM